MLTDDHDNSSKNEKGLPVRLSREFLSMKNCPSRVRFCHPRTKKRKPPDRILFSERPTKDINNNKKKKNNNNKQQQYQEHQN